MILRHCYYLLTGVPFQDEIVYCQKSTHPEYAKEDNKQCDWEIIFEKSGEFPVPESGDHSPLSMYNFLRSEGVHSNLDDTQLDAIKLFLENRVALIQVNCSCF